MAIRRGHPGKQPGAGAPRIGGDARARAKSEPKAKKAQKADGAQDAKRAREVADSHALSEGQSLRQVAEAVGEERSTQPVAEAPVDGNTPMALRMAALQHADDLSVDAQATEKLLRRAHDGLAENLDPELAMLHNRSALEGDTPDDGVHVDLDIKESPDGSTIEERRVSTRGSVAEGNLERDVAYERLEFADEGGLKTTRAAGRASLTGLRGEASYVSEGQDGGGVSLSGQGSFDGHRLSVDVEQLAGGEEVRRGVGGKADLHRLGFSADLQARERTAEGESSYAGGNVTYDPTGLSVSANAGAQDAAGNAIGYAGGAKLSGDLGGVSLARQSGEQVSANETHHTARVLDLMLGDKKAAGAYMGGKTRSSLDADGTLHKKSRFFAIGAELEAFREVEDLGPMPEDGPLAGRHRVEVHQKVDGGVNGFLGKLSDGLGFYGGLKVQKGKEVRYRTHVQPEQAEAMARRDEGLDVADRVAKMVVGHSLLTSEVELPDLKRPDRLQVHDELEVHTTGALDVNAGALAYGLRAGVQLRLAGDFTLRVKKTSPTEVEVEVMPTKVRGIQGRVGVLPAEVGAGVLHASAFVQRFSFDLTTKTGRAAYDGVVGGVLPGTLEAGDVDANKDGLDLVRQDDLPPGVARLRVEKLDVRETNRTGRVGWLLLSSSRTRSDRRLDHMATDGDVSVHLSSRTVEKKRNTLLTGNEHAGVTGSARLVTEFDWWGDKRTTFDALTLSAHYSDDKVKRDELNVDVIDDLNAAFGLDLAPAQLPGDKGSRAVVAQATLRPTDLLRLGNASPEDVVAAAAGDGKLTRALTQLVEQVKGDRDPAAQARAVQDFVAKQGSRGMGGVLRLAEVSDELELSTHSSTYDAPLRDAARFASRYAGRPWEPDAPKKELVKRYKSARETQEKIDVALERLDDDPLLAALPDEKERLRTELASAAQTLEDVVDLDDLSHDDAVTIHTRLGRGWTSKWDKRFQTELTERSGVRMRGSTRAGATATSHRVADDGVTRTTSATRQRFLPLFGDERTQVSAATRLVREGGKSVVAGVRLRATLLDEQSRGREVNRDQAGRVNDAFGTELGGLSRGDVRSGARRSLVVERELDPADLSRLASIDGEVLAAVAERSSRPRAVRALGDELSTARDDRDVARKLEAHVAQHGLDGMGDVHRLLGGGGDALSVSSKTNAYELALQDGAEVMRRWGAPVAASARPKDVAARFSDVAEARGTLERALEVVTGDRLTDTGTRYEASKALRRALAELDQTTSLTHLDHDEAVELGARLQGRAWSTPGDRAALERLEQDCGLQELDVSAFGGAVTSRTVRQLDDAGLTRETWSRRETASLLRSGEESVTVRAGRLVHDDAPLELHVTFHDTAETDRDLARRVVEPLNQLFGTRFDLATTRGDGGARTVEVTTELDDAGLLRLASAASTPDGKQLARYGLKRRHVVALQQELTAAPDATARARAAQAFVARRGLAGAGLLHTLAGAGDAPSVDSKSAGVQDALHDASQLLRTFGDTPLRGDMTKRELLHTLRELNEGLTRVRAAEQQVNADPLLDDERRASLAGACAARGRELERALSFAELSPDDREALAQRLDHGWTSVAQRGLIQKLRAA